MKESTTNWSDFTTTPISLAEGLNHSTFFVAPLRGSARKRNRTHICDTPEMLATFAPPRCRETTAFATTPSRGLGMTTRRSVASGTLPAGVTSEARRRYSPGFGCGGSVRVSVSGCGPARS